MKPVDGRTLDADARLDCDLCIVGGGVAGLTLATEMAGRGIAVILLEAGGARQEADSQSFYDGETVGDAHPAPHMYRQRRLGGSATIWGGRCVPYDPIDFERRDWVPLSGWPFARATLDPYYARAQDVLDAGAFDYSAASALGGGALVEGFADALVSDDSLERYSLPTNPWAKLGPGLVAAADVRMITNAACLGFITTEGQAVDHALFATGTDRRLRVHARQFVIAAGGIETVRLLARSGPAGSTAGLGNHADWLGRTYMCHVEAAIGTLRLGPAQRGVSYGFERTAEGVYTRRRFTIAADRQRQLGMMNAMARLHHANVVDPAHRDAILSTMFVAKRFIIPEYRRKLSMVEHAAAGEQRQDAAFWRAHAGNMVKGAPGLARFLGDWTVRRYLRRRKIPYVALHSPVGVYSLDINTEQAPNRDSRVTLSDEVDRYGVPRVRIDWRIGELDIHTVVATLRELRDAVARSGVGRIVYDDASVEAQARAAVPVGGHHIGAARMARDPAGGVVDPDLRVHHVANLYVAGCASFPTSGQANPTLTLVALAIRLADHLKGVTA